MFFFKNGAENWDLTSLEKFIKEKLGVEEADENRNIADLTDFVNTNKEQAGAAAAKCSRPPLEEVTEDFPPPPPEELGSDSESFKLSAVIAARSKVSLLVRLVVFSQCFNF